MHSEWKVPGSPLSTRLHAQDTSRYYWEFAPYTLSKTASALARDQQLVDTTIGWRFVNPLMKQAYGVDWMPKTSENFVADFSIARVDPDRFALCSQERALAAQASGRPAAEIVAVSIPGTKGASTSVGRDERLASRRSLRLRRRFGPGAW